MVIELLHETQGLEHEQAVHIRHAFGQHQAALAHHARAINRAVNHDVLVKAWIVHRIPANDLIARKKLLVRNSMSVAVFYAVVHVIHHVQINARLLFLQHAKARNDLGELRGIEPIIRVDDIKERPRRQFESMVHRTAPVAILLVNSHNNARITLGVIACHLKRAILRTVVDNEHFNLVARPNERIKTRVQIRRSIICGNGNCQQFRIRHTNHFNIDSKRPSRSVAVFRNCQSIAF